MSVQMNSGIVVVFGIGQKVQHNGVEGTISNLGFRAQDGSFVGADQGVLNYLLLNEDNQSLGWFPATEVHIPDMEVEEDIDKAIDFFEQDSNSPHLLDLGVKMLSWLDGLESRADNDNLLSLVPLLLAIQYDKEGSYGSSWKNRGEYRSIVPNIDRKYDRLDKATQDELDGKIKTLAELEQQLVNGTANAGDVGESKVDSVADLATYSLLYLTFIKENYPNVFKVWVDKNVPQYLRDKLQLV